MKNNKLLGIISVLAAGLAAFFCVLRAYLVLNSYNEVTNMFDSGIIEAVHNFGILISLVFIVVFANIMKKSFMGASRRITPSLRGSGFLFFISLLVFCYYSVANSNGSRFIEIAGVLCAFAAFSVFVTSVMGLKTQSLAFGCLIACAPFVLLIFASYFDTTHVLNSPIKAMFILAVSFMALFLLYEGRFYYSAPSPANYIMYGFMAVIGGLAYSVPNLVYYFVNKEPLYISPYYDILILFGAVYALSSLLSLRYDEEEYKRAEAVREEAKRLKEEAKRLKEEKKNSKNKKNEISEEKA